MFKHVDFHDEKLSNNRILLQKSLLPSDVPDPQFRVRIFFSK